MENEDIKEYSELLEEAKEIKKSLNLESIDTALLILIHQELTTISFHNCN